MLAAALFLPAESDQKKIMQDVAIVSAVICAYVLVLSLYYLNPFKKINRLIFGSRKNSPAWHFFPSRGGVIIGMSWMK